MNDPVVNDPVADPAQLDQLIESITVDAYGREEQITAFHSAFTDEVSLPVDIELVGVGVQVVAFDIREDDNELTALVRRDGVEQQLGLADQRFEPQSVVGWIHAAYRRCLGLPPHPATKPTDWELGD